MRLIFTFNLKYKPVNKSIFPFYGFKAIIFLMRWSVFCFLFATTILKLSFAQQRGTGLVMDDAMYQKSEKLVLGLNFSPPPAAKSLKQFCPPPGDQGETGSCVSWATGYAALSIMLAQQNEIPDSLFPKLARSPMFIFNQIKPSSCDIGTGLDTAFKFLKINGACAHKQFDTLNCLIQPHDTIKNRAKEFFIKEYYRLYNVADPASEKINAVLQSIASNKPVVIGMNIKKSIHRVGKNGMYKPKPDDDDDLPHAMCLVGYDTTTRLFEIFNSWGPKYGKGGFLYISFEDFVTYTPYAYQMVLDRNAPPSLASIGKADVLFAASRRTLRGEFVFKKYLENERVFQIIKPTYQDSVYTLEGGTVKLNSYFRLRAQNLTADTYVYIFSLKPDNSYEILFPRRKINDASDIFSLQVPMIPNERVTIEIPENKNNGLKTDQLGDDYFCILYSEQRIDDLNEKLQQLIKLQGSFNQRLSQLFGERLIPKDKIQFSKEDMKVKAQVSEAYILPIILKVKVN